MKQNRWKRLSCAALALQLLLSFAAEATSPIRLRYYSAQNVVTESEEQQNEETIGSLPVISDGEEENDSTQTTEEGSNDDKNSLPGSATDSSDQDKVTETTNEDGEDENADPINSASSTTDGNVEEGSAQENASAFGQPADSADDEGSGGDSTGSSAEGTNVPDGEAGTAATGTDLSVSDETGIDPTEIDASANGDAVAENCEQFTDVANVDGNAQQPADPSLEGGGTPTETTVPGENTEGTATLPEEGENRENTGASQAPAEEKAIVTKPTLRFAKRPTDYALLGETPVTLVDDGTFVADPPAFDIVYLFYGFGGELSTFVSEDGYALEAKSDESISSPGEWVKIYNEWRTYQTDYAYDNPDDGWCSRDSGIAYSSAPEGSYIGKLPGDSDIDVVRYPNKRLAGWYAVHFGSFVDWAETISNLSGLAVKAGSYGLSGLFPEAGLDADMRTLTYGILNEARVTMDALTASTPLENLYPNKNNNFSDYLVTNNAPIGLLAIGKWVPSSNATATDLRLFYKDDGTNANLDLYPADSLPAAEDLADSLPAPEDLAMRTRDELAADSVDKLTKGDPFDPQTTSYFARVSSNVEELTFSLEAYEPGSVLKVTVDGVNNGVAATDKYIRTVYSTEDGLVKTEPLKGTDRNTVTDPARGIWTLGKKDGKQVTIPLGSANETTKCNIITFTLTAPDGETTKKYTVYVQRITDPVMELKPGNTPYGMVMRDTDMNAEKKTSVINSFGTEKIAFSGSNSPTSPKNNNGYYVWMEYLPKAWGTGTNYDQSKEAIVVYLNDTFTDPGFVLSDGAMDQHDSAVTTDMAGVDIAWKLKLAKAGTLGPDAASDLVGTVGDVVCEGTGPVGTVNLIHQNVRPGVYTLTFTYVDPYELTETEHTFTRPVIVLPIRGDVDMDGAVTAADGMLLEKLVSAGYFNSIDNNDIAKNLYAYRVCDISGNGNVTQEDADSLKKGFTPQLWDQSNYKRNGYYYLPLNEFSRPQVGLVPGHSTDIAGRATAETATGSEPQISLKYMGVDQLQENGTTEFESGGKVDYDPTFKTVDGIRQHNYRTFWMEVQLENAADLAWKEGVTQLTLTLAYDPAYVEPYPIDEIKALEANSQWSGWTDLESGLDITPVAHYSKARTGLYGVESASKELRFSVSGLAKALSGGGTCSLLRVPFRLVGFPSGQTDTDTALVELTLGMRDLTLTASAGSAAWNTQGKSYGLTSVTTNLADVLKYGGSDKIPLGEDLTPSYTIYVSGGTLDDPRNPVYGEAFTSTTSGAAKGMSPQNLPSTSESATITWNGTFGGDFAAADGEEDGQKTVKELGLEYDPAACSFSGTPNRAGTYYFTFGLKDKEGNNSESELFRLVVEKAPLTLTPVAVKKYYGEDATVTTDRTFTYNKSQIKGLDLTAADKTVDKLEGTESELTGTLNMNGYQPPTITLVESEETRTPVDDKTHPGTYVVLMTGGSATNYAFQYAKTDANKNTYSTAELEILKRPVKVKAIPSSEESPLNGDTVLYATQTASHITGTVTEFTLDDLPAASSYSYAAPLEKRTLGTLNDESLELNYGANIQYKVPPDVDGSAFNLTASKETRNVHFAALSLPSGKADNDYYTLLDGGIGVKMTNWNVGTVVLTKTEVTELEVTIPPNILEYTYGGETITDENGTHAIPDRFTATGLKVTIKQSDGDDTHQPQNLIGNLINEGLKVQWVGVGEDGKPLAPTAEDPELTAADDGTLQMTHKDHDGKYLCISDPNSSAEPVYVGPYKVNKKTITLTLDRLNPPTGEDDAAYVNARYYGEDFPAWTVSYDRDSMGTWEKEQFTGTTGKITDFADLSGFVAPVIEMRESKALTLVRKALSTEPVTYTWTFSGANEVKKTTDVGNYYVTFGGAESDNYTFVYTRHDSLTSSTSTTDESFGYEPIVVVQRPIVITSIYTPVVGSLFQDSQVNYLDRSVTRTQENSEFINAELPDAYNSGDASSTTYYSTAAQYYRYYSDKMRLTEDAILDNDTLILTYRGTFVSNVDDPAPGAYFDLNGEPDMKVDVAVSNLKLAGSSVPNQNRNYLLVYPTSAAAGAGVPSQNILVKKGIVNLRKVKDMLLKRGPSNLNYTYGTPLNLTGMEFILYYDDGVGTNGEQKFKRESVAFSTTNEIVTDEFGNEVTRYTNTFAQHDLSVYWEIVDGEEATHGQAVSVTDGRKLVVAGPVYEDEKPSDRLVYDVGTVVVSQKLLNLSVVDQPSRFYGENNGTYQFAFDMGETTTQLAKWDWERVKTMAGEGSATDVNTPATSATLLAVDPTYVGPTFTTEADSAASVGVYDLSLSGGSMANYKFNCADTPVKGTITIEKRPIIVQSVGETDPEDPTKLLPVTAISKSAISNTSGYTANNIILVANKSVTDEEGNTSVKNQLTLGTSPVDRISSALVNNDDISVSMSVTYSSSYASLDLGTDYERDIQDATVSNMVLVQGSQNYLLRNVVPTIRETTATIYQRDITGIRIAAPFTKTIYTYGEEDGLLDLTGLSVNTTYQATGSLSEATTPVDNVWNQKGLFYINYWDVTKPLPAAEDLATYSPGSVDGVMVDYAITDVLLKNQAANGDHLTIAANANGFAHNGMGIMISARKGYGQEFVDPVLVTDRNGRPVTITVNPRPLTYTLTAQPKVYDGTTEAAGTMTLTNVQWNDEVWIKNGQYNNTEPFWPTDYVNKSSNYDHIGAGWYGNAGNGVKYTYDNANVRWNRAEPGNDTFETELVRTVSLSNISLGGKDAPNYAINTEVPAANPLIGSQNTPTNSIITPAERPAPDTDIDLWVDEHTNTVVVKPLRPITDFYVDPANDYAYTDDYNRELHYEYALVYYDEEGNPVRTEWQDSPYFGGEVVTVTVPSFTPGENNNHTERPEALSDPGQAKLAGDTGFGTRTALPRDTQISALVRLSPTNNFKVSPGTSSVVTRDDEGNMVSRFHEADVATEDFKRAFQAEAAAAEAKVAVQPIPEEESERLVERVEAPVIKTYTYRIDLVSAEEQKDTEGTTYIVPTLEEVWFTDKATFDTDKDLDRLLSNVDPRLYYGYYWDSKKSVSLNFPLDLSQDLEVEIPRSDDSGIKDMVNVMKDEDGNFVARIYVPLIRRGGSSITMPNRIVIDSPDLVLREGDDPVQLTVRFEPGTVLDRTVYWKSSDESVVKVSSTGEITIVGPGTATITVRSMLGGMVDTIEVRVLGKDEFFIPFADTMFNAAAEGSYMGVSEDGLFEPAKPLTRKELVVIMEHFFRYIDGVDLVPLKNYIDVPEDADYSDEVHILQQHGIIQGVNNNMFAPNWYATRGEISTILCRMLMLPVGDDPNAPHAFVDATPETHWAWAYIDALAEAGITKGTGDGLYNPERILTRAEVAVFIARVLVIKLNVTAENLVIPVDVTADHWAYEAVLLAVNGGAMLMTNQTTP